jgi:hypothetical protein
MFGIPVTVPQIYFEKFVGFSQNRTLKAEHDIPEGGSLM